MGEVVLPRTLRNLKSKIPSELGTPLNTPLEKPVYYPVWPTAAPVLAKESLPTLVALVEEVMC